MFINYALGIILALVALSLLFNEWRQLRQWRREPSEHFYSEAMFVRRAMISALMLLFIALVRFQSVAITKESSRLEVVVYLAFYLFDLLAIFLLTGIDLYRNRKAAALLEQEISALQLESIRLLAQAQAAQEQAAQAQTLNELDADKHNGDDSPTQVSLAEESSDDERGASK